MELRVWLSILGVLCGSLSGCGPADVKRGTGPAVQAPLSPPSAPTRVLDPTEEIVEEAALSREGSLCSPVEEELFSCQLVQSNVRLRTSVALCWCPLCVPDPAEVQSEEADAAEEAPRGSLLYRTGIAPFSREVGQALALGKNPLKGFVFQASGSKKPSLYKMVFGGAGLEVEGSVGKLSCDAASMVRGRDASYWQQISQRISLKEPDDPEEAPAPDDGVAKDQ